MAQISTQTTTAGQFKNLTAPEKPTPGAPRQTGKGTFGLGLTQSTDTGTQQNLGSGQWADFLGLKPATKDGNGFPTPLDGLRNLSGFIVDGGSMIAPLPLLFAANPFEYRPTLSTVKRDIFERIMDHTPEGQSLQQRNGDLRRQSHYTYDSRAVKRAITALGPENAELVKSVGRGIGDYLWGAEEGSYGKDSQQEQISSMLLKLYASPHFTKGATPMTTEEIQASLWKLTSEIMQGPGALPPAPVDPSMTGPGLHRPGANTPRTPAKERGSR